MSYGIWLEIDTGAGNMATVVDDMNYTSNVSKMWRKALEGATIGRFQVESLGDMDGITARLCVPALWHAVAAMNADPLTYQAMDPANGWGDWGGAREFLEKLAKACELHPNATVRISR